MTASHLRPRAALTVFFNGWLYPLTVAAIIFLAHTFALEPFGIAAVMLLVLLACFICTDCRFLLPPLAGLFCIISPAHSPAFAPVSDFFFSGIMPIFLIGCSVLLVLGLVLFAVRQRHKFQQFSFDSQMPGLIAFAIGILCNGFFTNGYTVNNLVYALLLCLSIPLLYFFMAVFLPRTVEVRDYFFFTLLCTGLLVVAELAVLYATKVQFDGLIPIKDSITIGWGRWTNIAAFLAMLLPSAFYFAHSHPKGPWFLIPGGLIYLGLIFSGSRGGLLYGTLILLLCLALLFFTGKNKKRNRMAILGICLLMLIAIGFLMPKIIAFLGLYINYGLSDNGRFALWREAFVCFTQAPIFGKGFFGTGILLEYEAFQLFPHTCHNTFLHLMATGGIACLAAYLYHRALTIRLAIQKRKSPGALFLLLCIAALLLCSLTDEHLFHFYPGFLYAVALHLAQIPEKATQADILS